MDGLVVIGATVNGAFVGDAVLIRTGVLVVGTIVVMVGVNVFVGVSVGRGTGGTVGFRVGAVVG